MRLAWLLVAALIASPAAMAAPGRWTAPRTPDGTPDLQGFWTNASLTKLTRARGSKGPAASEGEAKTWAASQARATEDDSAPTDPGAEAPAAGAAIRGYNMFWLDPGSSMAKVRGEYRSSWIVDPADGQLPLSDQGRALIAKAAAFARAADHPTGPEALEPWDRCLISSRGSGGPGMLNNIYNSNYQIVQTPGFVAIAVEMVHDVRTIPIFPDKAAALAGHGPAALEPWLGDSTGWWEGDSLVVETVHVKREQGRAGPLYLSPQGRVTERFTRVGPGEILYEFRVEDPVYYSRPWRAEMILTSKPGRMFEYACHEGNYALPDILRGTRMEETRAATR